MISWTAALWLGPISVLASYTPNIEVHEAIDSSHPSIIYDPSWNLVYPQATPAMNASYEPGAVGYSWGAYQSNVTGASASFSLPFYGFGISALDMALTPFNETETTSNITLSLDGITWTIPVNATSIANISLDIWPSIDFPHLVSNVSANHTLTVSVSNVIATFRQLFIMMRVQANV